MLLHRREPGAGVGRCWCWWPGGAVAARILGHGGAGIVEATGRAVERIRPGDRVKGPSIGGRLYRHGDRSVLADLADSDDEEIAEAVDEAIGMAETLPDEEDDEEVGSE